MPRQHIQWLPNLQLAQFHCSLGACSSALQTMFSPTCGAWHWAPALAPGGSGMEKDTSLDKVEQAGARLMHKLPAAVWLSDLPCVLLHHNQHKPTEIYSSQNTEVAPVVFCRTEVQVWLGCCWLLFAQRLGASVLQVCPRASPGWPAQGLTENWTSCQPSLAPKVLCTALAAKTRLLVLWMLE